MGYQVVGIVVIVAFTSIISAPAFYIMRKLHILIVSKAVEEIGLDVAELSGIPEEFIEAINEAIDEKTRICKKLADMAKHEHDNKSAVSHDEELKPIFEKTP